MKLVKHILDSKGNDIWAIGPEDTVLDAIRMMADKGIGALLVMDAGSLVGIVSERDYARKVILQGKASDSTPVSEIMTREVVVTAAEVTVGECMTLMTEKRIRHLPVTKEDDVIGVLSIGDLVKAIIAEQEYTIQQLENYISA